MDPERFDDLTKRLVTSGASRRRLLQTLSGGVAGAVLAGVGWRPVGARGGGNSACAHFCAAAFGADTPEAGQCTSDAAHGKGTCIACSADINRFCGGACVDLSTALNNCGGCKNVCTSPDVCHTPVCAAGVCGTTATVNFDTDVNNCGSCGNVCHGDDCNAPTCTTGVCGKTPANGGGSCNNGTGGCVRGTCKAGCATTGASCVNSADCCAGFCLYNGGSTGICHCAASGDVVATVQDCCSGEGTYSGAVVTCS